MARFISFVFAFVFILALLAAAGLYGWTQNAYTARGTNDTPDIFMIERGQGVATIAYRLEDKNLIRYPLLFRIKARISGADTSLKAGEYEIPAYASMQDILSLFENGDVYQRKFTVPEGLTSWQIVQYLNGLPELTGTIEDIPNEGTLLPETYHYTLGDDRNEKLGRMQSAMTETLDRLWDLRQPDLPVKTKQEALTLASIVEKETGIASERKRVAGVFINRLRIGMAMQTDPTVIYAITKGEIQDNGKGPLGRRLLLKDLEIDSPYNTYKYPGLPPGPIANPGAESIEAVLNPEDHDYLYFVADGTGGHAFGKTLTDHNNNVAKWRKFRKSKTP